MAISCSHDDCQSPSRWKPVLLLRSRPRDAGRQISFERLGYCDAHRESLTLATFLSDEGWKKIARALREAGKEKCDQNHTLLTWTRLSKADLHRIGRLQHHTSTVEETDVAKAELAF
jgi:hypothetical protein